MQDGFGWTNGVLRALLVLYPQTVQASRPSDIPEGPAGVSAAAGSLTVAMALDGHAGPSLGDFSVAFLVVSFVSLTAAPVALLMPRDSGMETSGHGGRA